MAQHTTILKIVHEHAKNEFEVSLKDLTAALDDFLDHLAVQPLVDRRFAEIIGNGTGAAKRARLMEACGYVGSEKGFFGEMLEKLGRADGTGSLDIGGIEMPHLLLMAILEVVMPGNRFISVKNTEQLEELTNRPLPESDRVAMQEVIDTYPVRLSMHTLRQMRVSANVAYQYLPFVEELDTVGHTNTWIGQFHQGLLEQMYQNRVIFLLNMGCPVYCRFCFRKHKEARNEPNPLVEDVKAAVEHVKNSPSIKEIVVTGGDPFMNRDNMAATIDGLMEVDHVQTLRLATRSIAYYPHMFLAEDGRLLRYLKRKKLELEERGKRMEVATHFIHPDEVSPQSLQIIAELVGAGIMVYVQTPFLKDCNDKGPELVRLYGLLRGAGAELHYIYIPCSPIHGNSIYWAPLSKGLEVGRYLRAHLSDRVIPRICTATPIGKMDWNTSGWAVEPVEENDNFIWIRSPYTPGYFKQFAPLANKLDNIRVNEEGTIDIQYMARIGDESLFFGSRPRPQQEEAPWRAAPAKEVDFTRKVEAMTDSLAATGSGRVSRVHETRVELHTQCGGEEIAYIRDDELITDVVVIADDDALDHLSEVAGIAKALDDIPHVNAIRLRSLKFNHSPQSFTPAVIDRLAGLNRLSLAGPKRLEIETRFHTAGEIGAEHGRVAGLLRNRGITVYCNTPLLGGVNDTAENIHQLAYACRQAGIEFHHLYITGLDFQKEWNRENPVALDDVIDIATRVRREGSGREVPRYIIKTAIGEVDYGLSGLVVGEKTEVALKVLCYDMAYFQAFAPGFVWPDGVREDADGQPVVPLTGIEKTNDFILS